MEPYDVKSNTWPSYSKRMDQFFLANGLSRGGEETAARQRAIFLTLIGQDAFQILESLLTPTEPGAADLETIKKVLTDHFAPAPLEIAETIRFRRRYQGETESAAQYLAALRQGTKHCAFSNLERALRDQFVTGLRDMATQQKILGTKDLTLEKALQIATSLEDAKRQAPILRSVSSEAPRQVEKINARSSPPRRSSQGSPTCYRCGGKGHTPSDCWHKDKVCQSCKKKGHLERVCRSKQKTEQKQPLKRTTKSKYGAKAHSVAAVEADWDEDGGEYYLNAINAIGGDTPRITVTPKINGKSITMEVDTGAAVSIISRKTWMDMQLQRVPAQSRKRGVNHVLTRQIRSPGTGTDDC